MKFKTFACLGLVALATSFASAQQSPSLPGSLVDWPQFNFDAGHDGYNPYETILNATNVKNVTLKWSSDANQVKGEPVVVNGTVYITSGGFGGQDPVYALNADTGALIWKYTDIAGPIFASPAVSNGRVYVSDADYMYALDAATGALIWDYDLPIGNVYSSPTVVDDVVYIGCADGNVYALNGTNGTILWKYKTAGGLYTSPAVAGGLLYVSSGPGFVYALNAGTGVLVWKKQFGSSIGPPSSLAGTHAGQTVANGVLYVEIQRRSGSSYDLYALNANTGAFIWRSDSIGSLFSTPAVANGVIYVSTGDQVAALNATTGAPIWQTQVYGVALAPIVANGVVYVGSWYLIGDETGDGTITALRASDGASLWTQTTRGGMYEPGFPSPAVVNGAIYGPIANGSVGAWSLPN